MSELRRGWIDPAHLSDVGVALANGIKAFRELIPVREDRVTEADIEAVKKWLWGKLRPTDRSLDDDIRELLALILGEEVSRV